MTTTTPTLTDFVAVAETDQQRVVLDRLARADRQALGGVPLTGMMDRRAGFALVGQGIASVASDGLFYLTLLGRLVTYCLRAGRDEESEAGK